MRLQQASLAQPGAACAFQVEEIESFNAEHAQREPFEPYAR